MTTPTTPKNFPRNFPRKLDALPLVAIKAAVGEATMEAWRQSRTLSILTSKRQMN